MKKVAIYLALLFFWQSLNAQSQIPNDADLKKMIGKMLIVGFDDESIDENSKIVQQIQKYELGGVILFDRHFKDRSKIKNISSPEQLKTLTTALRTFAKKPLLISVDQEGGKVARLKPAYGFEATPSAKRVSEMDEYMAKNVYNSLAKTLTYSGINCNFAPVVDLSLNPKNSVIVGLDRSYSSSASEVVKYSKIFIDAQSAKHIISVAKHFPGHGSSLGDSHEGFVDISKTWSRVELEPYKELIDAKILDMVMTAHVFNSQLDEKYPATLSYSVNTKLLRDEMNFKGVIVSDDLQMGAILKHYSLEEIVKLTINAGVDMLLFGNQLATQDIDELVELIFRSIKSGDISYDRILESNKRVDLLYKNL